ncbi:Glutamate receptor 1 [Cichlidogyrus casuarinus]|uniref:Glutamate receptor 1 n=1 Tax=Cichlidogyrus casuarinus TaxID=1844966 RepID=A0ABD2QII4_9PLAT
MHWSPRDGLELQIKQSNSLNQKKNAINFGQYDPNVRVDPHRFDGLMTRPLRVVTILNPPFVQRKVHRNSSGNSIPEYKDGKETGEYLEGFCIDLIVNIRNKIGFDFHVHVVADGNFGSLVKDSPNEIEVKVRNNYTGVEEVRLLSQHNQEWNGMVGELIKDKADLAVAPLTINHARALVVDFSEPFLTFGISLMIKKPEIQKSGTFSFLHPLSYKLWLTICLAWFVVAVSLYLIAKISPYEWENHVSSEVELKQHTDKTVHRAYTFSNSCWFAFAAFVQQSVDFAPKSAGGRIVSAVWWFFTLIIIAYYTANLAAFLTVSKRVSPINDWNDLETANIKFGTLKGGSTHAFFNKTNITVFQNLGNIMRHCEDCHCENAAAGWQRTSNSQGRYAFIMESVMNQYFNNRNPCNTMMVGSTFGDKGYGVAFPKRSPLKKNISNTILRLREDQVLEMMRKSWWNDRSECAEDDSHLSRGKTLTLESVTGIFYILTGGLILALFATLLEFYLHIRRYKQEGLRRQLMEATTDDSGQIFCVEEPRQQWIDDTHRLHVMEPTMPQLLTTFGHVHKGRKELVPTTMSFCETEMTSSFKFV